MNCERREFLLGAAAVLCAGGASAEGLEGGTDSIRIAHLADPQFGFEASDDPRPDDAQAYERDLARFEKTVDAVNALKPDLCFIAGDMTHRYDDLERDWPRLLKRIKVPLVVSPGNHDLCNPVRRDLVERFIKVFGYEYTSVKVGPWRFISGNSNYWYPTDAADLKERYEAWFIRELASAREKGEPVILGAHHAPFMRSMDEGNSYGNCPHALRQKRVALYADSGVRYFLAGHAHRVFMRAVKNIMVFNAASTCRNFDDTPFGFRLFTARADGTHSWDFRPI